MARVLRFSLPRERLDPGQEALLRIVGVSAGPEGTRAHELAIANGVWVATGEAPREEFLLGVRQYHGGSVEVADFRGDPEGSRRAINGWVSERTRGRITDLIPPRGIGPRERLVLANAVYFKGRWALPFDAGRTRKLPFHTGGRNFAVPMMQQVESFGYAEDARVQVVELPYRGHALAAIVVLPREIDGLPALERELDWPMLQRWVEQVRPRSVALTLPKFKLSSDFALAERLAGMGMRKAFDPAAADLSGILGKPGDLLWARSSTGPLPRWTRRAPRRPRPPASGSSSDAPPSPRRWSWTTLSCSSCATRRPGRSSSWGAWSIPADARSI
jgi:serpin B